MSVSDLIRYLFMTAIFLTVAIIGLKFYGKQKTEKKIVTELRTLANPTSSFEQFYAEDAQKALYQSMAQMHLAEKKLGREAGELLERVFRGKGDGALFPMEDPTSNRSPDPQETLIREGLLRNYQNCKTLGVFENSSNLRLLEEGEAPGISSGPATGANPVIRFLIDPEVSPGVEMLIPNMVISPPEKPRDRPTDLQIRQAKGLTSLLYRADLLERDAERRIIDHYDMIANPPEEEEEEEEKPTPAPEPEPELEAEPVTP